jgi:hypothetical protein
MAEREHGGVSATAEFDEFAATLASQLRDPAFRAAYEAVLRRECRAYPGALAVDGHEYRRRQRARHKRKR